MKTRIINYIKAGYPCLYIVSQEEQRVEHLMHDVMTTLNVTYRRDPFTLKSWSFTDGLKKIELLPNNRPEADDEQKEATDPLEMLEAFYAAPQKTVFLVRDFHVFIEDKQPVLWRKLKDCLLQAKANNKTMVILGCRFAVPVELEKEIVMINYTLPDREQLRTVLHALLENNGHSVESLEDEVGILAAASGLTTTEAENAFALSYVERGKICREVVYREKVNTVKKGGLLDVMESTLTLDDVGGLENLKAWLVEKKDQFLDEAMEYGLEPPKGIILVGQPGCGKTETAKACGTVFGIPMLRLDAGKLFGSLVGQSEQNWRAVHDTAKAMAPCILFIDEIDGIGGTGDNLDAGVTDRVVKSILQSMEDDSRGIFYIGTANDVDRIKAPLLRRFEEVFSVELPTEVERQQILAIQLSRVKRDPSKFNVAEIANRMEGFSGAEIKKIVKAALSRAFADRRRQPTDEDLLFVTSATKPLSETMAEDINKRRARLAGVARPASNTNSTNKLNAKGTRKVSLARTDLN